MRTPRWRKKRCPATMLHHLTAILTFFARESTLADVNNIAISLSLSLFSDRSSPLPYDTAFPSLQGCRRSPVIPFIFRCSLLTREFPWLRYPPGGWNQSCFCSLHLSLASSFLPPSFSFPPSAALQFSAVPGRDHLRSSDVIPSIGPAVSRNYDVAWRRIRRVLRPVAFTIACCTHRPTLAATGHLRLMFSFRQGNENFAAQRRDTNP